MAVKDRETLTIRVTVSTVRQLLGQTNSKLLELLAECGAGLYTQRCRDMLLSAEHELERVLGHVKQLNRRLAIESRAQ